MPATTSTSTPDKTRPLALIIEPDHDRREAYTRSLCYDFRIRMESMADLALRKLKYDTRLPDVAIVNSYVGNCYTAEEAIAEIKRISPDTKILAVMKTQISDGGDRILENLMCAGADHVVSRYDLGPRFQGINEAVEIAMQGRLSAYGGREGETTIRRTEQKGKS